ncbi:uncharacterized protein LOC143899319 [Temnothorax americanus]|uniref:uncharacterized protein LOC143899319 n=1 Tax=Temnothorax americanus TaxID=1964332 RepID=UPI004068605F
MVSDMETLSDHQYIEVMIRGGPPGLLTRRLAAGKKQRRWALKKLDADLLQAAILALTWGKEVANPGGAEADTDDVDEIAGDMVRLVSRACDVAMPRLTPMPPRRQAYWWTEKLAALRRFSVRAKRRWRRARAGRHDGDALSEVEAGRAWRSARQDLAREICAAKERAWKELLGSVNEDP